MTVSNFLLAGSLSEMTSFSAAAYFVIFLPVTLILYSVFPKNAKKYFLDLKERKILVRYFAMERISSFVRFSVGSREEIATLLETTRELLAD